MRARITVALVTALLSGPAMALNPNNRVSQYAHTAWRLQDGIFGSFPTTIAQTSDGYIWVGTQSGVVRFDGVRFSPWNPAGGEQLGSSQITALLGTDDGSLWIGTASASLWRWKDQRLTRYFEKDHLVVESIVEGANGLVWVSSMNPDRLESLCEISSQQTRCYGESDGLPHSCCFEVAVAHLGDLWVSTGKAVLKWKPQSPARQIYALAPTLGQTSIIVHGIYPGDGNSLWIGVNEPGNGLGLEHIADRAARPYKAANWDGSTIGVGNLLLDRHQVLWVGTTSHGLYHIRNGSVDHFASGDGLSGDSVLNFLEDREGNIWVVTTKGIDCFRDLAVVTFSYRVGLSTTESDSVLVAADGALWVGGNGALDAVRGQQIISYRSGKGLPGHQVSSLFEDHEAHVWVGLDNKLFILKNGIFSEIKGPNGEPLGFVTDMVEDKEKNIWAEVRSNRRELVEIANLRLKRQFPVPEMPAARKLAADPQGGIWLGLMNGDLARYTHDKLDIFHYPHGTDPLINQVSVEADGSVIGATAGGLIGWHDGKQTILTVENGLPCNGVNAFARDNFGEMWLYMQCALVQVPAQDLRRWWDDPNIKVKVRAFDFADGMQPGVAPFQGAARTPDGKLWFANLSVLQMIDPAHLSRNSVTPPVHVEEVTADRHTFSAITDLKLPALTRDIAIRYTALSFVAPQRVYFRYMLEGQDNTWQEAGTRREAFYTNLAPRSYRFRVIACNNDGLWNETGDSFSFTIEPAYYQTTWFAFLCVAAVVGMLWLLYILRLRQAQEHIEQRLGARLEEREQIARELHDTLLQGFQGLMLRFQSVLKMLPANEPVHKAMESVLERADEVLLEGRQSVQGIRKDGADSAALEEALAECGHELSETYTADFTVAVVGTPQALGPVIFDDVYRIAREALFNAFQHAHATKIEAELTYGDKGVFLRIRDNGIGIDPDFLSTGKTGHWGLSGMRERAKKIGATLKVWTKPGSGTEIELTIPARVLSPFARRQHFWRRIHGARQWPRKSQQPKRSS